jgi:GGDEF domain-containing protein
MIMMPHEASEETRLRALRDLDILDTPAEARFDRITRMAVDILRVPMAAVELVDATRVWLKSAQGLHELDGPREGSFADGVIRESGSLIVMDAQSDGRFRNHPWVSQGHRARFHAGHPLRVKGEAVGSLSLMGPEPRSLSVAEARILLDLAAIVERELVIRRWSSGQEDTLAAHPSDRRRSLLDSQTGMWNRSGLSEVLWHEIGRASQPGGVLGVMMASVQPSRPSRTVLRELAGLLRGVLRPSDALGLWDESTFLALFPGWDAGTVERIALDAMAAVRSRAGHRPPSLSIGITSTERGRRLEPDALLRLAESALLDARAPGAAGLRVRRSGSGSPVRRRGEAGEIPEMTEALVMPSGA